MRGRRINDAERETVRRLYADTPTAEIARLIGRTEQSVYNIAHDMGIKKSEAYTKKHLAECGRRFGEAGKAHRFKKGQIPPNKGLRRPGWAPGRMAETQFKKGVRQGVAVKLYKPIGTERIRKSGYLERKVNDDLPLQNRWKGIHRIVWEEHNGPIPEGSNVVFKDGNKLNCDISNLEMITDAELMSRNTLHNYPEPLKEQIHILAGFKRKLNRYAKKQDRRSA